MTRTELVANAIELMGEEVKVSKKVGEAFEKALEQAIINAVATKEKVSLVGYGTYEAIERKPRMGRNPKTNIEMPIEGGFAPKFKASKLFKDAVKEANK